ncbi:MAG: PHP domain-containing protein [bacterium]
MPADLHIHSTVSDGELSPTEIVARASSLGLSTIALTDHDTVDGIKEAYLAGEKYGIEVIAGVELSTDYQDSEVHILGYFIKPNQSLLCSKLEELRQHRHKRALEMVQKLQFLGLDLNWSQVKQHVQGDVIGRPHIARVMVDLGYVKSVSEAFALYLEKGRPAYVPRTKLSPKEAITLINQSKGVAVMAHPGLFPKRYLGELLNLGWQGIEVFHPEHDQVTITNLQRVAKEYNLVPTGGSDFHGNSRKDRNLGTYVVSEEIVTELKARCLF